uniref:creatine kinase n=1 Tax=Hippocampus comes TaxID=109280 RepID=A0A3Q2Y3W7_HIPCM
MTTCCLRSQCVLCLLAPGWPATGPMAEACGETHSRSISFRSMKCKFKFTSSFERHNDDNTFLVWVNEEEHLKVISIEKGGNMKAAFTRFCSGIQEVESKLNEKELEFMWNDHLGYILTCPSNLGTGLRAGVHVKLPNLSKRPEFEEVLKRLRLEKRTGGVDTEADSEVLDISNTDRLGFTEVQLVQVVVDGVKVLVEMEKRLEMEEGIDDLMPVQK